MKGFLIRNINAILSAIGFSLINADRRKAYEITSQDITAILHLFVQNQKLQGDDCFFIQIGANDGVKSDNFQRLIFKYELPGILVEPLPEEFQSLKKNYRECSQLYFENAAISDVTGEMPLFRFKETPELETSQFSSFNRSHLEKWQQKLKKTKQLKLQIEETLVASLTFTDLLNKYSVDKISVLVIDVEGYDFEIIKQINFQKIKPLAIQFEHINFIPKVKLDCYHYLSEIGYDLYQGKMDTLALYSSVIQ